MNGQKRNLKVKNNTFNGMEGVINNEIKDTHNFWHTKVLLKIFYFGSYRRG